jgi:hypothetical protein
MAIFDIPWGFDEIRRAIRESPLQNANKKMQYCSNRIFRERTQTLP